MSDSHKNTNPAYALPDTDACAEFQKHLPELLEEENPSLSSHPHIKTCEKCAALVRDLEAIAQAARELLPTYEPSPDLWSKLQTAMNTSPTGKNEPDAEGNSVGKK